MESTGAEVQAIIRYVKSAYGAEPEFLWARSPKNAVLRHRNGSKY